MRPAASPRYQSPHLVEGIDHLQNPRLEMFVERVFRGAKGDGDAELGVGLPEWVWQTRLAALLDHEHAAPSCLFHQPAKVKDVGDVGIAEHENHCSR